MEVCAHLWNSTIKPSEANSQFYCLVNFYSSYFRHAYAGLQSGTYEDMCMYFRVSFPAPMLFLSAETALTSNTLGHDALILKWAVRLRSVLFTSVLAGGVHTQPHGVEGPANAPLLIMWNEPGKASRDGSSMEAAAQRRVHLTRVFSWRLYDRSGRLCHQT